ncbi:hypothetical protein PGA1_262p01630 (plasmid) [Phaeobacter inhibens DSM 17395]|nr:hypothetical protein PGA1_262p01630 [Phaeobacter inhibens DSM 17395]
MFRDLCSGFGPLLTVVIFPRGEPVEARMRAVVIVVVARGSGQVSGIAQAREQVFVQALSLGLEKPLGLRGSCRINENPERH